MDTFVSGDRLPTLRDFADPSYNPFASEVTSFGEVVDFHSKVAALMERGAVHPRTLHDVFMPTPWTALGEVRPFMILGYDPVFKAFTDPETFSNAILIKTAGLGFGRSLTTMDPPEHSKYRLIFQKAFLPNVVAKWGETVVGPVVENLISEFHDRGKADLVEDFTHHFPFHIIYNQLGLDGQHRALFHKLAVTLTLSRSPADIPSIAEAKENLGNFFRELIQQRIEKPGDDLVSHLVHTEVDGERLPEEILVSFLRQLMNAAGDTTFRGTSNLLVGLLTNPDQLEAVRRDHSLIPQAIEEGLRWESPVTSMLRQTTREVEIDGTVIPGNSVVDLVISSANRDPSKYAHPHRFDIFRERRIRAIPFATGPHVCVGQHLARLEISRALSALLDRLPNMRLDPAYSIPEIVGYAMRRPKNIHVLFDA